MFNCSKWWWEMSSSSVWICTRSNIFNHIITCKYCFQAQLLLMVKNSSFSRLFSSLGLVTLPNLTTSFLRRLCSNLHPPPRLCLTSLGGNFTTKVHLLKFFLLSNKSHIWEREFSGLCSFFRLFDERKSIIKNQTFSSAILTQLKWRNFALVMFLGFCKEKLRCCYRSQENVELSSSSADPPPHDDDEFDVIYFHIFKWYLPHGYLWILRWFLIPP